MPSGWDVYYVVFLSAVLALGLPAALILASRLLNPPKKEAPKRIRDDLLVGEMTGRLVFTPPPVETELGRRTNTRFFLGANAALVLITFGLILIPCVGTLQPEAGHEQALRALTLILSLVTFSALGLLYSARKGDLHWLRSFRKSTDLEENQP